MDIISKKIMILDDIHTMVKVRWKSNFIKRDRVKGSIEFEKHIFYPENE